MYARIIVDLAIDQPLDYLCAPDCAPVSAGAICVVPVGKRDQTGLCVGTASSSGIDPAKIRPLRRIVEDIAPLSKRWLELTRFTADYYQHAWGEVAIPALPPLLRQPPGPRFASVLARLRARGDPGNAAPPVAPFRLNDDQAAAVAAIASGQGFAPTLLFGVTGSGKTVVYLESIARVLARDASAQCLLLVPEIGLTAQLIAQVSAHFSSATVVSMHSGMADRERAEAWLAAHEGRARIVIGTRLAVLASLPRLALIIVDEEHDPSYKAGDGVRLSARDLAVMRGQIEQTPVVLGSATPSLESWSRAAAGRYRLLRLPRRAREAITPTIDMIDLTKPPQLAQPSAGVSDTLANAIEQTVQAGAQALVFINRRGYAPALSCAACGWVSQCPHCSVFAAYHKSDATLRCHHCGWHQRVPRQCPTCGNQDLDAVGQGTQRIEEMLRRRLPQCRIARIDRDSTRRRGAAADAFDAMHAGATDVLVGTQMIAKGHDFQRVALVGVLNADAQLKSPDFRASERLFATLMQVAGRAGRASGRGSRVWVQTRYPDHPLLAAYARQDYERFATALLAERRAASMPPFVFQALLTAEAREMDTALDFLAQARDLAGAMAMAVRVFEPVPMPVAKVGGVHRAQLLVEADRRRDLQDFLRQWLRAARIAAKQFRPRVRMRIEVDPQEI